MVAKTGLRLEHTNKDVICIQRCAKGDTLCIP